MLLTECVDRYYKTNTNTCTSCSSNCLNPLCDKTSGRCNGCVTGRYGDQCSTRCPTGCLNDRCLQSGLCSSCKAGYTGSTCSGCVTGRYGDQCSTPCPSGCLNACDQQSGKCASCKDGWYGDQCSTHCPTGCLNDRCLQSGLCSSCKASYTGSTCSGCVTGRYGVQCTTPCPSGCLNACDQQSGKCASCKDGWYGDQCSTPCPSGCLNACDQQSGKCATCKDGLHGDQCTSRCPIGCLNDICLQSGLCSSCKAGYTGSTCSGCVTGRYGDQCSTRCPTGCLNVCDQQSGLCSSCKAGYTGSTCSECQDGYYTNSGVCSQCSSNCRSRMCDKTTGVCKGCVTGRYGDQCTTPCPSGCLNACDQQSGKCASCKDGLHGDQCTSRCPTGCLNDRCLQSGLCSSCKAGFTGSTCSGCVTGWYGDQCSTPCPTGCLNACDQQSARCVSCKDGWYGDQCSTRCPTRCLNDICLQSGLCSSCKAGYTGSNCSGCPDGYYTNSGVCSQCSSNCRSRMCDKTTGMCKGCVTGRYGEQCTTPCPSGCLNACDQQSGKCASCKDGLHGDQCTSRCPTGCLNDTCLQSGLCSSCKAGYTGSTCSGCVTGRYGDQCSTRCPTGCLHVCDQQSGLCSSCKAGYTGSTCSECQDGYYTNSGVCSQCSSNCRSRMCDKTTGVCKGCVTGRYGDRCTTPCPSGCLNTCDQQSGKCASCKDGLHGDQCTSRCPTGCLNDRCLQSGLCSSCKAGYTGSTCSGCQDGYYTNSGVCSQCSSNCRSRMCDKTTGMCKGCVTGWYGEQCTFSCPSGCLNACDQQSGKCASCKDGLHGDQCTSRCPTGCLNDTCLQSGLCSSCKAGYTGSTCSGCVTGRYGDQCSTRCPTGCLHVCDQQSGLCSSCKAGYTGSTCSECQDGYYTNSGVCSQCSSNCRSRMCDKTTGVCKGCVTGWYGDHCTTPCPSGCLNTCDQQSGKCASCKDGLHGDQCTSRCPTGCLSDICLQSGLCSSCKAGYTGSTCSDNTKYFEFGSQQGDITLTKGKQKLSAEIIIPSGLPIAGNIVRKVFVSMKGLMSFGRKYDSFNVRSLPVPGYHLMCAYWADLRLPFNDEANVWYQVYRRNEHNTAKEMAMLTKGGQRVKQYANTDSYLPVVMLVVTFEKVPLGGVSTDTAERVNFQMVVVSDGFTTYGIVIYPSGGMQVDSRLNRPVTIGYLNRTLSEVTSPDTLTGNTDHEGVWFYPLSTQVENAAQKCMNWYFGERSQVKSYRTAILFLAPCPCVKLLAEISTTLLPEDVIGDLACFLTTSTSTKTPYAQRCCYNQTTGGFIQTRPVAGSFLLHHPKVNPVGHSLMDIRPKEYCCQHSRLCDKYYEVRPISTCQFFTYIQSMGTGDPHLTTLDGKTFPFNAVGEFTLLRFQQPGFELQARTCVATSSQVTSVAASVFCAFAAKGSNSTFQVEMNMNKTGLNVKVDRQDLTRKFQNDASFSHTIAGLSVYKTQDGAVKAFFTEGVGLTVSVKNRQLTIEVGVYVNTSGLPPPTGLLGNLNGNAEDDFIFPNGTTLPNNISEQDLLGYGKTWAVTDDNSLFVYEGGWGTSQYTNDSFQPLFLSEIPNHKLAEAQKVCGGVADLSCIYDFVATDDKDLAAGTKSAIDWLKVIFEMAGNVAPTLSGPARIEVILGQTTSVTFSAKDEDDVTPPNILIIQQPLSFACNKTTYTCQFTPGSINVSSMVVVAEDSKGAVSPSFSIDIVLCTGCSNQGSCNFNTTRPSVDEYFQLATCDCQPYYAGDDCEADLDACADDPCPLNATCTDLSIKDHMTAGPTSAGYQCGGCPDGYLNRVIGGVFTCHDIDECRSQPALCQQLCTNTMGSYQCSCKTGYRTHAANASLCTDIDECQENTHGCQHQCVNTEGSYQCSCFSGFTLNTTDLHTCVRESVADPCTAVSPPCAYACKNESGVVQCLCPSGYGLAADHRTCEDVNECDLNQCSQKCKNTYGSYACSCYIGFQLDADKVTCKACSTNQWGDNCNNTCDCRGRGTCHRVKGCVCDSGWSGVTCSDDVNECKIMAAPCPASQICGNNPGSFVCVCPSGFVKVNGTLCVGMKSFDVGTWTS
ncbi:hypothetical protein ACOMHN_062702 [Nucella lapillus]